MEASVIYEAITDPGAYLRAYTALMAEPTNQLRISAVQKLLRRIDRPVRRVLDVASGGGAYVPAVRQAVAGGSSARFVPVDRQFACVSAYRMANERATPTMGDVATLPFRGRTFDLALCLDIIEHLDDDVAFLRNVCRLVRPGGWVLVCTHNSRSLQHVMGLAEAVIRRETWRGWDPTHIRFYNVSSLRRVMNAAGLEVTALNGTYFVPFHLPARLLSWPLERLGFPAVSGLVHRVVQAPFYALNRGFELLSDVRPLSSLGWGIIALGRTATDAETTQ